MSLDTGLEAERKAPRRGRPPKSKDAAESKRVAFPQTLLDSLEAVRKKTGADSITDVLKDALRVYAYLSHAHQNGSQVIIRDQNGQDTAITIFMPLPQLD